jgi:LPS export ABC transporter protein LptC
MWNRFLLFFCVLAFVACKTKTADPSAISIYAGPVATVYNVKTDYSDSAKTKIMMKAPLQLEFQDGDREFPKGIRVDFYDPTSKNTSRLTAKYARYEKTFDIYVAKDSVVILDLVEDKTMNTEELRWSRPKRRVYTDKFVRIRTKQEILTGVGLEAAQDFTWYKILKPAGNFSTNPL